MRYFLCEAGHRSEFLFLLRAVSDVSDVSEAEHRSEFLVLLRTVSDVSRMSLGCL